MMSEQEEETEDKPGKSIRFPQEEVIEDRGIPIDDHLSDPPEEEKAKKYIDIDVPQLDKDGNEIMARVTVPVIKEEKQRNFRIVKRKRVVLKTVYEGDKEVDKEEIEEYDACMLVETVKQTVRLRLVKKDGTVDVKEQDFEQEFYIGKERKYKFVQVEKTLEDGTVQQVEELEVETESEEEMDHRRKRKRKKVYKPIYDSHHEYLGQRFEWEWTDEGEGRVREEFSHIEEEEIKSEEEYQEEEFELDEEEWKELFEEEEEGEEEEVEEEDLQKREKERMRQKASFYKLMKMFLREIQRRKVLMRDIKIFTHLSGMKVESPGKEFDENPQKFIDIEVSEIDALIKHIFKKYEEYKEEDQKLKETMQKVVKECSQSVMDHKNSLLDLIQQCNPETLKKVSKGIDLTRLVEETFKYEELLTKTLAKKALTAFHIEQLKFMLFAEVDQSHLPDEDKEIDVFLLDKIDKMMKSHEAQKIEDLGKREKEKSKFISLMEDKVCKEREVKFLAESKKKIIDEQEEIKKIITEKRKAELILRKYIEQWRKDAQKEKKYNFRQRFPAIYENQKKINALMASPDFWLEHLKQTCPEAYKELEEALRTMEPSE